MDSAVVVDEAADNLDEINGSVKQISINSVRTEEFLAIKMNQMIWFVNEPYFCFPAYRDNPSSKLLAVLKNAYEHPSRLKHLRQSVIWHIDELDCWY